MTKYLIALLLSMVCLSCWAHRPHRYYQPHRHHHVTVVTTPAKPVICNKITVHDRMNMAIAYLNKDKQMSVAAYSKMTRLPKAAAEAELDAFSLNENIPICIRIVGKKKVYVLTN